MAVKPAGELTESNASINGGRLQERILPIISADHQMEALTPPKDGQVVNNIQRSVHITLGGTSSIRRRDTTIHERADVLDGTHDDLAHFEIPSRFPDGAYTTWRAREDHVPRLQPTDTR